MASEQVGLLVIRAQAQEGCRGRLRANVRFTHDTTHGFTHELNLADVEDVSEVVRQWLNSLIGLHD
jgi:hypothetical protein